MLVESNLTCWRYHDIMKLGKLRIFSLSSFSTNSAVFSVALCRQHSIFCPNTTLSGLFVLWTFARCQNLIKGDDIKVWCRQTRRYFDSTIYKFKPWLKLSKVLMCEYTQWYWYCVTYVFCFKFPPFCQFSGS